MSERVEPGQQTAILEDMTIQRMDNVLIVVDDLEAAGKSGTRPGFPVSPGRVLWLRCVLLGRVGNDSDVRLGRLPIAEQLLGFVVVDRPGDDDVLATLPVHRRRDLVLGRQL